MDDTDLTPREFDLLKLIARFTSSSGENRIPDNSWLAQRLHVRPSAISNYKNSLKQKGYLGGNSKAISLTKQALEVLANSQFVLPARIPVLGKVKAGRVRQDEIVVEMGNINGLDNVSLETITIPYVEDTSEVFALKVVGQSMVEENIFAGDYVIVQRFKETETPKQGELIVTLYLHVDDEKDVDLEYLNTGGQPPEEYLEGPTIKYFYMRNGKIRLSQRKDIAMNEYTIETRYYYPIGRVIGIYRAIR